MDIKSLSLQLTPHPNYGSACAKQVFIELSNPIRYTTTNRRACQIRFRLACRSAKSDKELIR